MQALASGYCHCVSLAIALVSGLNDHIQTLSQAQLQAAVVPQWSLLVLFTLRLTREACALLWGKHHQTVGSLCFLWTSLLLTQADGRGVLS